MEPKITHENNFCQVFEFHPDHFPKGYCPRGGHPCDFRMVDWFYPIPTDHVDKGEFKTWDEYEEMITTFLKRKIYIVPGMHYLVLTRFGKSFTFEVGL